MSPQWKRSDCINLATLLALMGHLISLESSSARSTSPSGHVGKGRHGIWPEKSSALLPCMHLQLCAASATGTGQATYTCQSTKCLQVLYPFTRLPQCLFLRMTTNLVVLRAPFAASLGGGFGDGGRSSGEGALEDGGCVRGDGGSDDGGGCDRGGGPVTGRGWDWGVGGVRGRGGGRSGDGGRCTTGGARGRGGGRGCGGGGEVRPDGGLGREGRDWGGEGDSGEGRGEGVWVGEGCGDGVGGWGLGCGNGGGGEDLASGGGDGGGRVCESATIRTTFTYKQGVSTASRPRASGCMTQGDSSHPAAQM